MFVKTISLFAILNLFNIFNIYLVSSQATKETLFRIFNALWEISFKFPIGVPTIYKMPFSGSSFLWDNKELFFISMIKLPSGVDINHLIDDIRIFSWQATDILLYYRLLENSDNKKYNKNNNEDNPVTLADLKVNEIIIEGIKEKYKNINWDILSEEDIKISSKIFDSKNEWIWVLDPLDRTKDFIQITGNYAMHLALNFKQNPILDLF